MRSNFAYDLWEFRDVLEHLLIAPKRHVESLLELTPEERADIMEIAARYEADHYDIYARGVASITRTVPKHQHTHLIKSADKPSKLAVYVTKPHFLFKV
jgi:diadenosine tetraphosphate (Ap4A) HIT family hydrolase